MIWGFFVNVGFTLIDLFLHTWRNIHTLKNEQEMSDYPTEVIYYFS